MNHQKGFSLMELLIAMVIASILMVFAVAIFKSAEVDCKDPSQRPGFLARAYEANEIAKLGKIVLKLETHYLNHSRYPDTLDELLGHGGLGITVEDITDRWGGRFEYRQVWNETNMGKVRKYKNIHPVNHAFDLYSPGPDGKTATPFTSSPGCDDVVVANDGLYIGYAYRYYAHAGNK